MFDRSSTGPGHGRDFPKPSEQASSRSVGVHAGHTCQIGQNSFSGELEECTARVISRSRGLHVRTFEGSSGCDGCSRADVRSMFQADQVATALMGARLVPVAKPDGGVRGIATGCTFRRLVAKTFAKQFVALFEAECSLFQHALSTRASTDCVVWATCFGQPQIVTLP